MAARLAVDSNSTNALILAPTQGLPPPPGMNPMLSGPPPGPPPMTMDALIDPDVYHTIEMVINVGFINFLAVFGSAGNALTIYILYQHGLSSSSTNIVLVSLAAADLILLVTLPLRKVSLIVAYFDEALATTVESYVICYHFLTLNRIWSLISHTHVVIIGVERFLAVYFPFQVGRWVTPTKMTIVVIITHAVWYIALTPLFTMFQLIWVTDPSLNETIAIPGLSDFFLEHEAAIQFYNSFVVNLFTAAVQLSLVLTCSIAIGLKVIRMTEARKRMVLNVSADKDSSTSTRNRVYSSSSSDSGIDAKYRVSGSEPSVNENKENGLHLNPDYVTEVTRSKGGKRTSTVSTSPEISSNESSTSHSTQGSSAISRTGKAKRSSSSPSPGSVNLKVVHMLLSVCIVYLVFVFPTFLLFIFQYVFEELREPYWRRVNFLATSVEKLVVAINSSVNCLIYVWMSERFYNSFIKIISCWKRSNESSASLTDTMGSRVLVNKIQK